MLLLSISLVGGVCPEDVPNRGKLSIWVEWVERLGICYEL